MQLQWLGTALKLFTDGSPNDFDFRNIAANPELICQVNELKTQKVVALWGIPYSPGDSPVSRVLGST